MAHTGRSADRRNSDIQIDFRLLSNENIGDPSSHLHQEMSHDELTRERSTITQPSNHLGNAVSMSSARRALKEKARQQRRLLTRFRCPSSSSSDGEQKPSPSATHAVDSDTGVHKRQSLCKSSSVSDSVVSSANSILASVSSTTRISSPGRAKTRVSLNRVPLKHERALTVTSSPRFRRRCSTGNALDDDDTSIALDLAKPTSSTSTSDLDVTNQSTGQKTIMESVLLDNVLVLQSDSCSAVEAVSLRTVKKATGKSEESHYVSYTERLIQEGAPPEDCVSVDEIMECEEKNLDKEHLLSSNLDKRSTSEEQMLTTPVERLDGVRSYRVERYEVLTPKACRASSDPLLLSRHTPVVYGRPASCLTGPSPEHCDQDSASHESQPNYFSLSQPDVAEDLCGASEAKHQLEDTYPRSFNTGTSFAPPLETIGENSGAEGESDISFREANPPNRQNPLLVDRGRSNISTTSVLSEGHDWKELYLSFDLESVGSMSTGFSHATSFGKPLNIPVSQEFKDMTTELTQNPQILLKWLNPL